MNGNMSQPRILVVDDSDDLRTVFCRLLGSRWISGHERKDR